MNPRLSIVELYQALKAGLPTSTDADRKKWAKTIVDEDLDLERLSKLLFDDKKIAMRFAWLLSNVGVENPEKLHKALPYLFEQRNQSSHENFSESFANYWVICGVPIENESSAITLLFDWLMSADVNTTIKSRSIKVLLALIGKYPELKNEFILCLQDQMGKYSKNFDLKLERTLSAMSDQTDGSCV